MIVEDDEEELPYENQMDVDQGLEENPVGIYIEGEVIEIIQVPSVHNQIAIPTLQEIEVVNPPENNPSESGNAPLVQSNNVLESEVEDEQPPNKTNNLTFSENDEGICCTICLEPWTNVGDHRVSALKCGHLFGHKCIKRWITDTSKTCPTCKRHAAVRDLRFLYINKLIALDTSEVEKLKQDLDKVCQERNILDKELSQAVVKHYKMVQEVEELKRKIFDLEKQLEFQKQTSLSQSSCNVKKTESKRIYMDKSLEINKEGGCRVIDCSSKSDLLIISTKSNNPLFNGYGVKKVSLSAYKATTFIPLHSMAIRDISFHPLVSNFLTVSLDKSFKYIDNCSNSVIFSKSTTSPLWSCCWDSNNPNYFFIGEQQGSTVQYDIRNVSENVKTFAQDRDMSPVVSLAYLKTTNEPFAQGCLICCKLNGVYALIKTDGDDYESHWLPFSGPFVNVRSDPESEQFLLSARPNSSAPHSRHSLVSLSQDPDTEKVLGNSLHCFKGGSMHKMLSRSAVIPGSNDKYVAAYEESHKGILLWSTSSGQQALSIPAHEPVLDLCGFVFQDNMFLASLTEKKVVFYKYS